LIQPSEAKAIARQLKGLADPTRLLVAYRLAGGPHHVTQLAGLTGTTVLNLSHHLRMMRLAGLIDSQRQGGRIVYSLRPRIFTPGRRPGVLGTLALGTYRLHLLDGPADKPGRKK
jgi:DNA-binding transcriptional ArsR family regulator